MMTRGEARCGSALAAIAMIVSLMLGATPTAAAQPAPAAAVQTLGGIRLDTPWKQAIYGFARSKLLHSAWGWRHSERNYLLAVDLAAREGLRIDRDILFAAAFAHDIGAIGEFQKEGVDHAVRSVELAEPLLRDAGFPMSKWPAVREAILGHMHDKQPDSRHESIVLHDADTLDFLGTIGVARRLAVTGPETDYEAGVTRIRDFADKLPTRLVTATAKQIASRRVAEMRAFLRQLDEETLDGRLR